MTPQDIETIRNHPFVESSSPVVTLAKGTTGLGERMSGFCDQLKALAPNITIKKESDIAFEAPVLVIGRHRNIAYYALPAEKILPLFLNALDTDSTNEQGLSDAIEKGLERIDLPAGLKLYVAGQCPHCPQTIRQIQLLTAQCPLLRLEIINVDLFPEKAKNDKIRSVPTIVLDQAFRWTGQVSSEELLTVCAQRDPSQLSAMSLRQLIEDGNAERVAKMMVESGRVFTALVELLTHQRWSVRLGAMVAAEYLADEAPDLGLNLFKLLWRGFPEMSPPVQGDVTHLFGLIDSDITKGYLHDLASGGYDDQVKEAANEVLGEMGT